MQPGLIDAIAAGRCGTFSKGTRNRTIGLHTCVLQGLQIFSFGYSSTFIGEAALEPEVIISREAASWTGCRYTVASGNRSFELEARTTLPGPVFTAGQKEWGFDWALPSSPLKLEYLPEGTEKQAWAEIDDFPQVVLVHTKNGPVLMVLSEAPEKLEIITHEHWRFTFFERGVRIMLVPLLREDDAPRTAAAIGDWARILQNPPTACSEEFERTGHTITIRSRFTGPDGSPASAAPVNPPVMLARTGGLVTLNEPRTLFNSITGPFGIIEGTEHLRTVQMDWAGAAIVSGRDAEGIEGPLPFELAYAGDASWDESTPMDQLLSWRLWARFADVMPGALWADLKERLKVPGVEAFKDSLREYTESVTGRTWAKEKDLFAHCGDVSYDTDWYTGLTLSGLRHACECADQEISTAAQELSAAVSDERQAMMAYFAIFCDWAWGAAWTDCRGEGLNLDCSHNGLEGILAQAKLCRREEDRQGEEWALYLAASAAPVFIASMELQKHNEFAEANETRFGYAAWREWDAVEPQDVRRRPPYNLAGDFPEFCALLKQYGNMGLMRNQAHAYAEKTPERYTDWLAFYVGQAAADAIRADTSNMGFAQEVREQASVFYHVAPDTALRLWILDQDPDEVERMYQEPMPLNCRLLCRGGFKLEA